MITITKMMITKMPMIAPMMPLFTVHLHVGVAPPARGASVRATDWCSPTAP